MTYVIQNHICITIVIQTVLQRYDKTRVPVLQM